MEAKTRELINVLNQIETLLQEDKQNHWLKLISSANKSIKNSDYSGIETLLSYFGGMGSFNDLIIGQTQKNGKFEWKKNDCENNDKPHELRLAAYELSIYISHHH